MRKEGRIVFGLLFLSALILILFSPSVSAVECSGGQQANYLGCSGEYTISQQSTGSCWYHDPYYSYWPNGTIRSIWNYKAQGISNGIYCWEYGTSAQCWSEEEYCEWYVGGQYTTLYDCSEIPTESGCLSLESGGCTAEYSCECPSGTNLQVVGEEFAHCLGTYDVTYTNPAYCSWRGVGCAGSSPEQCEANSYCTWTGKCFSSVSNTCDGHSNQGSCNSDSNCNWIPEQTITGPFGLCYSSYPTESQCLSHQVDGCNAVYDNVYQCTADPHCSDSDGSPTNYNTRGFIHSNNGAILNGYNEYNGHASDFCFESAGDPYVPVPSGDGLQEYGCSGTTSVLNSSGGCSYGCTGGKCNPAPPTCSDSDGGLVYNVLGTVSASSGASGEDYCVSQSAVSAGLWTDPTLGSSSGPYIVEYACGSGNYGNQILYQCPAGCSNGVCNPVAPFCTDSDGGINYNTRGTATTEQGQFPDYCTDAGKLKEYSCSGISKVVTTYECSNECFSGACVNLYFGDSQGNNLTNYSSKHVGDIIYLWVKNPPFTFSQTDSFKLKESDSGEGLFNPDDTIRSGLGSFTLFSGTSIGTQITLFQSDIDACSPSGESLEGANCEFYFEIVNDGITYFSQKNSPYLRVPVNYSGLGLNDNLQRYWADSNDLSIKWNSLSYTGQARTVGLVMLNSSGAIANEEDGPTASIVFHIYAQDDSIESPPYDFGSYNGNFYDVDEDGEADDAYYLWTINDNVINTVSSYDNDGSYQFYFEVESGTSSVLTVTQNLGTCGNGICEPPAENETNCDDCLASCAGVNYCMDYVTQDSCLNDFCDVASQTPPPAGPGQTDACGWNSYSDPACNKAIYSITGNGSSIGSCVSEQNSMSEECNGGFLSYSWTSKWTWYPGNSFSTEVLCEAYSLDCEGNCLQELGKNIWHCDPDGSAASCIDGSAQIPCPAQIQLNFFDLKNLIVAVLLIFVLYVILHKTRQSKKKYKKSSKK